MDEDIRVLQILSNLKRNGPAFVALDLSSELRKRNITIIIASSGGELVDQVELHDIEHIYIPIERIYNSKLAFFSYFIGFIRSMLILRNIIRKYHINIIHAHQPVPIFLSVILSKVFRIPLLTTAHNIYNPKILSHKMYTKGSHIVAVSDTVKENMIKAFNIDVHRITTIHNGINFKRVSACRLSSFRKEFGIGNNSIIVGMVAGLRKQKAVDVFIKAAKVVLKNYRDKKDIKFVIVGDGELKDDLCRLADLLGISKSIIFTGFRNDIPQILHEIDIFCLSSDYEGLPISILEALASRKTVIATAVGGTPELIINGVNGLLVPPQNVNKLASALISVINNPDLRTNFERNSYSTFKDKFTNNAMATKYIQIYDKILAR